MANQTFCEQCRCTVDVKNEQVTTLTNFKGLEFEYTYRESFCSCCGEVVYTPDSNDARLEALYRAYDVAKAIELQIAEQEAALSVIDDALDSLVESSFNH